MCSQTERRLRVVALRAAEEFRQGGDVLGELVFAPDLPLSVRRHLPAAVARIGLRSVQGQKDGKIYVAIHFRTRVDKVRLTMVMIIYVRGGFLPRLRGFPWNRN